jgi:hypothetical protein
MNLSSFKYVNELYKENYKPMKYEIKEDCRIWKDFPCSWIVEHSKNGCITKSNLYV